MVSARADGMAARNVVPQTTEPRGFLRRRRTDEPAPPSPVEPVRVDADPPAPAPPAEVAPVQHADDLSRAQAALLQAALRQADELIAALDHEQQLRRQETERLTAENQLLRDALATLNAQALQRQQQVEAAPARDLLLPEQREHAPAVRQGRRRSARQAGPA